MSWARSCGKYRTDRLPVLSREAAEEMQQDGEREGPAGNGIISPQSQLLHEVDSTVGESGVAYQNGLPAKASHLPVRTEHVLDRWASSGVLELAEASY